MTGEKTAAERAETMAVREAHALPVDKLAAYLAQHLEGFAPPLSVVEFRGGQSNPTYKLSTHAGAYVLRRKPPGKLLPSAHAVDREYRVMAALGPTDVPVPRTYLFCEDAEIAGTPFYIMEYLEGRIFWDATLPGMTRPERADIYDAMNEVIARLHGIDHAAVGLIGFGRPGGYVGRQIARWTKQYRASETEPNEPMERLIEWLPANLPADDETTIVHGDYRLDNMVFHPTEPRVLGVLDWEISTLGHPLADFAYHCMLWRMTKDSYRGLIGHDLGSLGIPSEEEYVAAYCARTGRSDLAHWDYYMAYNMFRMAAILQGIMGRVRDGTAASAEAARTGTLARPVAEAGWAQVEKMAG